ncbi:MAG: ribonuclease III [Alphaproteobacteria bacterium]|nr:ribonuclease III [Alphaproteobacteria bacterium]
MRALAERIGYSFRDESLLALALSHPSLGRETSNQRLEFLGDSVLGLVIAELLYEMYPAEQEGELARRLAALVRGETLVGIAEALALGEALQLSASEAGSGGRKAASNLEDALESLIGAIYLDGGIDAAKNFIKPLWQGLASAAVNPPKDAKTALQEWAQARGIPVPNYTVTSQTGPAHAPEFTVEVSVERNGTASATAASKRAAEQAAAGKLLNILEKR